MFSFLSSATTKIIETLQDFGYFDREEISEIKAKYIPGLELQFTSEYLQEYDWNSITSTCHNKEIGILYKLKYGEIGATVLCKSSPIAQFTGTLRALDHRASLILTSMSVFDIYRHKLEKWNAGFKLLVGSMSCHLNLEADKWMFSTRHRIHPKFVILGVNDVKFIGEPYLKSTFALGFEFEFNSSTTIEAMFSDLHAPTFAFQYQCSKPQCLVRVFGDVYSKRTGVSFAFHLSSISFF